MTPVSKAARALRAIIALALIPSAASAAEGLRAPRVALDLVSEYSAAPVGMPFHVGVRFRLEQGWHIYWKNPGDSGREPRLKWKVPAGATVGPIEWPMPKRFPLPPLANYGFDGEPILPVTVTLASPLRAGAQAKIGLDLDWLVCRVECIPGKGHLDLTLPLTAQDHGQVNAQNQSLIRAALALVPTDAPATVDARFAWADGKFALEARDHGGGAWDRAESVEFFPEDGKLWVHGEEPNAQMGPRSLRIEGRANPERREPPVAVAGVLVFHPAHAGLPPWAYRIQAMPGADPPGRGGLAILLFFAFLGGMLLNLMPCVLPVLTLKTLAFAGHARGHAAERRAQGWAYTLGVVASFWILAGLLLAFRAGGRSLGWGFQLQSPIFVAALTVLFVLLGLNLLGVFEVGTRLMGLASAGSHIKEAHGFAALRGSFLTGALATLAATPCTAPFMGAALGAAVSRPSLEAFLIFTSLGVGMAGPYLVLSHLPGAGKLLPKPGMWMVRLKQLLAIPMFATALWLGWVEVTLMQTTGPAQTTTVSPGSHEAGPGKAWSRAEQQRLLAEGHGVLVDFTAAWCLTCQVNLRLVLRQPKIEAALAAADIHLLEADWTAADPAISEELQSLGRTGVPAYALYPAGGGPGSRPMLLPEILTESAVLDAIQASAGKR